MPTNWVIKILFGVMLCSMKAWAAAPPQIVINHIDSKMAGYVQDGEVLAKGIISANDDHVGFQLWFDGASSGTRLNSFILTGQQRGKILSVRLKHKDAVNNTVENKGVTILSDKNRVFFDVVANGHQKVVSDIYRFNIQGNTLY